MTVTWAAPGDTGGSEITGYKVQWRTEDQQYNASRRQATLADPLERSHEITGLANGTKHFVRVLATNDVANGEPSAEASFTPARKPDAPRSVAAQRGDRSVTVTWAAPGDGGSEITGYKVQWRTGVQTFNQSSRQWLVGADDLSYLVTGLANGTEHFVRVLATNDVANGEPSAEVSFTPARKPDAPRSVAAQRGDRSVAVQWAVPAADGGSEITGYKVQWRTDRQTFNQSSRQRQVGADDLLYEVTGLANGTKHFVRVLAVNDVGDGEPSAEVSVTPARKPDAPVELTIEVRDRALGVAWGQPDGGGLRILNYRIQWRAHNGDFKGSDSTLIVPSGSRYTYSIGPLVNGTEYFVRVRAINGVGNGLWAPTMSATPAIVPSVPLNLAVQPGDESMTVTWQEPASDGGSALTAYKVQWRAEDETYAVSRQATLTDPTDLRHEILGLTNGTEYWVRVWAVNAAGEGPSETSSGAFRTVPEAPGTPIIHSSSGSLTISWDPPENDGGWKVTEYRVQWKGPGQEYNETDRQATLTDPRGQITGLTNGVEYTVRIAAVNSLGLGPAVEVSKVVAHPPGAPRSPRVIARNQSLQVSWTPPEEAVNSPITEYRVLWRAPDQDFNDSKCSFRRVSVPSDGDLIAVVGPLGNGTTYHIQIAAVSDDGPGAAVEISGAPAAIPGPARAVGAFSVDGGLLVDWDAPWDGGSPITGYRVQWKGSGEDYNDSDRQATVGASSLSHEITGLANGSEYSVRVLAINNNGTSRVSQTGPCPDTEPGRCDGYVAEATGTPGDAPGPPRSAVALVNDAPGVRCDATVTWEAPTDAGGSAITSYRLQWKFAWENHYSELVEITDLTELSHALVLNYWPCGGRVYVFRITAVNSVGVGPPAEVTSGS